MTNKITPLEKSNLDKACARFNQATKILQEVFRFDIDIINELNNQIAEEKDYITKSTFSTYKNLPKHRKYDTVFLSKYRKLFILIDSLLKTKEFNKVWNTSTEQYEEIETIEDLSSTERQSSNSINENELDNLKGVWEFFSWAAANKNSADPLLNMDGINSSRIEIIDSTTVHCRSGKSFFTGHLQGITAHKFYFELYSKKLKRKAFFMANTEGKDLTTISKLTVGYLDSGYGGEVTIGLGVLIRHKNKVVKPQRYSIEKMEEESEKDPNYKGIVTFLKGTELNAPFYEKAIFGIDTED